ncbi:sugar phosphate isomerase/epimerase family protein [Flavitalea sp. BT771]|uniref:sugar phosphate isomerase/epimerase family protein n=1 Tax=Flavitalea sp. BT771 TaxID=3063329 RepID=UPI0026E21C1E|nr:sugar phosphate isomerase/epimerase family protein [Flavitalea sp. BT771]MDO6433814.1 sugar phosphate isomerase/epimerase family protein [Flavitalea sp. BT771]MDV6222281.1 sugar phosphate isomerase/epimerase family protein [Flavitalea sp. BT771]
MNISSSRRDFLKAGAGLLGLSGLSTLSFRKQPLLSFSTLGCPDWTFPAIMDFATKNGYSGVEVRGILREMDLVKCPEFSNAENIAATLRQMEDHQLKFVNLGSSAELHLADAAARQRNLDEGRRFIDLAHQLRCPYIRVFPNRLPKEQDQNATIGLITKGLLELGEHARNSGVTVLMETHGDLVETAVLEQIMQGASGPNTGLIWDIFNMWSITKEPPAEVYPKLKKYIRHTHIKDGKTIGGHMENRKMVDGKEQYLLLGQGESPIFEAIGLLYKDGYPGFYSFEWEKLWHPEIAEPEVALADYPKAMKKFFRLTS